MSSTAEERLKADRIDVGEQLERIAEHVYDFERALRQIAERDTWEGKIAKAALEGVGGSHRCKAVAEDKRCIKEAGLGANHCAVHADLEK